MLWRERAAAQLRGVRPHTSEDRVTETIDVRTSADQILMLERGALDRWGKGDPGGFLEVYAPDITYFDPVTAARIEGHQAMADYYRPWVGKIQVSRYEMLNPQVVVDGNMALLTYNLVNYVQDAQGVESVGSCWNSRRCTSTVVVHGRRSTRTGRSLATPRFRTCRQRRPSDRGRDNGSGNRNSSLRSNIEMKPTRPWLRATATRGSFRTLGRLWVFK